MSNSNSEKKGFSFFSMTSLVAGWCLSVITVLLMHPFYDAMKSPFGSLSFSRVLGWMVLAWMFLPLLRFFQPFKGQEEEVSGKWYFWYGVLLCGCLLLQPVLDYYSSYINAFAKQVRFFIMELLRNGEVDPFDPYHPSNWRKR